MEKTVKTRAYPGDANSQASQGNPADDKALELAMKDAQLEEEKSRSLEHLKTIVQLRENLKQEQAKTAEMAKKAAELEAKVTESAALEANALAKKNAQLEEEKGKVLEYLKTIVQLRESIKQEQAKAAGMADKLAGLDARAKEIAALEAKVKEVPVLEARIKELAALEVKIKEMAVLEAKVKELTEALGKISGIAAAGKGGW